MDNRKKELNAMAERLRANLDEMKKPLVIEFTGTPKAGKTLCVDATSKFLRRHGIPLHVVTERASICPIRNKKHIFFNTWTGCMSLANMIDAIQSNVNVVILDRGIFDTLVWMTYMNKDKLVTDKELEAIEAYYLLEPWKNFIDIVVALSVKPKISLQREYKDQITDIMGSIMNPDTLTDYNSSFFQCIEKYQGSFRRILQIDTTDKLPVDGVAEIASAVLKAADELVDEEVAVVDRKYINSIFSHNNIITNPEAIEAVIEEIAGKINWIRRTQAEESTALVQLIAAGVIRRDNEILVFNHRGVKQGRMIDRNSIWAGGHIRRSDHPQGTHKRNLFRRGLVRELGEELNLRFEMDNLPLLPAALVWDNTTPKSALHVGVLFDHELSTRVSRSNLHERELWESATKSLFSRYVPLDDSLLEISDWEAWSTSYLRERYGIDFPKSDPTQPVLF